jgi:hypothetical protein
LEGAMAPHPCIATDSQWQRWTLLIHLLKLLWGS